MRFHLPNMRQAARGLCPTCLKPVVRLYEDGSFEYECGDKHAAAIEAYLAAGEPDDWPEPDPEQVKPKHASYS